MDVAAFHNGKVIVTGMKSIKQFYDVVSTLISFLESTHISEEKDLHFATRHFYFKERKKLRTKVSL